MKKINPNQIREFIKSETEGCLTYTNNHRIVAIKFDSETLVEIGSGGFINNLSKEPPVEEIIIKQVFSSTYIFNDLIKYIVQINYDSTINGFNKTYTFHFIENLKELVLDDYD